MMTDQTLAGAKKGHGMDWLHRLLPSYRTPADERRAKQTKDTLSLADDFFTEMRESIRAVQEAGADDRKGYPVEHALRRRRSQ